MQTSSSLLQARCIGRRSSLIQHAQVVHVQERGQAAHLGATHIQTAQLCHLAKWRKVRHFCAAQVEFLEVRDALSPLWAADAWEAKPVEEKWNRVGVSFDLWMTPMAGGDDNDLELLVERAGSGDRNAFDSLVQRTHRLAFQLAYRMLGDEAAAEDVLQDAYLRVWQGLGRLRDRRAVLGWICQVVRNVATDRLRRQTRRAAADADPLLEAIGSTTDGDPERALADAQERMVLAAALSELKEKHRLVLLFREVDDMSYEEIATALGCPIGTVESRLYRARRLLGDKLRRVQRKRDEEAA